MVWVLLLLATHLVVVWVLCQAYLLFYQRSANPEAFRQRNAEADARAAAEAVANAAEAAEAAAAADAAEVAAAIAAVEAMQIADMADAVSKTTASRGGGQTEDNDAASASGNAPASQGFVSALRANAHAVVDAVGGALRAIVSASPATATTTTTPAPASADTTKRTTTMYVCLSAPQIGMQCEEAPTVPSLGSRIASPHRIGGVVGRLP